MKNRRLRERRLTMELTFRLGDSASRGVVAHHCPKSLPLRRGLSSAGLKYLLAYARRLAVVNRDTNIQRAVG